jgi:hypothetical protein
VFSAAVFSSFESFSFSGVHCSRCYRSENKITILILIDNYRLAGALQFVNSLPAEGKCDRLEKLQAITFSNTTCISFRGMILLLQL